MTAPPAPLRLIGGLFRGLGKAIDSVGAGLQGRLASPETGKVEEREGAAKGGVVLFAPRSPFRSGGGEGDMHLGMHSAGVAGRSLS